MPDDAAPKEPSPSKDGHDSAAGLCGIHGPDLLLFSARATEQDALCNVITEESCDQKKT
jgi:hypothetical protein